MTRRVVITGMGAVTPLGHDVEQMWQGVLGGRSGISQATLFDARTFPTQFSAEVRNYDHMTWIPADCGELHRKASRHSSFLLGAAWQAWQQAKLPFPLPEQAADTAPAADRVGIYLGAGEGQIDFDPFISLTADGWQPDQKNMDWKTWARAGLERLDSRKEMEQEPNMPGAHLAQLFKLRGPCMSCLTACAASTQAIGEALELIRFGDADLIIAGGTHSMIHPLGVTGFNRLTALSTRNDDPATSSRPFDKSRDGFVLAEGAGVIIRSEEHTSELQSP